MSNHQERRIAALLSLSAQERWRPFTHLHCVLAQMSFRVTLALMSSKVDTPIKRTEHTCYRPFCLSIYPFIPNYELLITNYLYDNGLPPVTPMHSPVM